MARGTVSKGSGVRTKAAPWKGCNLCHDVARTTGRFCPGCAVAIPTPRSDRTVSASKRLKRFGFLPPGMAVPHPLCKKTVRQDGGIGGAV